MARLRLRLLFFEALMLSRLYGGSLEGRVTDSVTGVGIGGVSVALISPVQAGPLAVATTDGAGTYKFGAIADGTYAAVPAKESYVRVVLSPPALNQVTVSGDTHVDLKMTRLARLRGRVTDVEKKPLAGMTVKVFLDGDPTPGVPVVTDSQGEFETRGLRPATYTLQAEVKLDRETADGERMVTTFYPSAVDRVQSVPVALGGADLSGLDIQMRTALVRRIRGVVRDIDGDPAAQTIVMLIKPGDGTGVAQDLEQVLTDDAGLFEFTPVTEGEFRVQGDNSLDYDYEEHHPLTRSAAQRVVVSDRPLDPVELRLGPPFAVDISVEWRDGDEPAPVHPKASVDVARLDLQPGILSRSETDGRQRIAGLFPGRYLIDAAKPDFLRVNPPDTAKYYLASVRLNGRDVLGQAIELLGPSSVEVIYRTGAGSVRGRAAECSLGIVRLIGESGRAFWTTCDAQGAFAIGNVPPGEYTIGSARVKVDAGAVVTVELK